MLPNQGPSTMAICLDLRKKSQCSCKKMDIRFFIACAWNESKSSAGWCQIEEQLQLQKSALITVCSLPLFTHLGCPLCCNSPGYFFRDYAYFWVDLGRWMRAGPGFSWKSTCKLTSIWQLKQIGWTQCGNGGICHVIHIFHLWPLHRG